MRKAGLEVIAVLFSESGCDWSEEEYSVEIQTIGLLNVEFINDVKEAVQEWVSDMKGRLKNDCFYNLMMRHVYEFDGASACHSRYFEVFDVSFQEI